jgi:hypothetical protein
MSEPRFVRRTLIEAYCLCRCAIEGACRIIQIVDSHPVFGEEWSPDHAAELLGALSRCQEALREVWIGLHGALVGPVHTELQSILRRGALLAKVPDASLASAFGVAGELSAHEASANAARQICWAADSMLGDETRVTAFRGHSPAELARALKGEWWRKEPPRPQRDPAVDLLNIELMAAAQIDKPADGCEAIEEFEELPEPPTIKQLDKAQKALPPSESIQPSVILSEAAAAVLAVIRDQPRGQGITGPAICQKLEGRGRIMDESTLTTRHIPILKKHFGVKNKRRIGYYVEGPRGG